MLSLSKKIASFAVAALMAAPLLSCGEQASIKQPASTTGAGGAAESAEPAVTSAIDQLGENDFGGRKYVVYESNDMDIQQNCPEEELNGEIVNDGLITRDTFIEDRFNIDISYAQEDNLEKVKSSVMAGEDNYQFIIADLIGSLSTMATSGQLMNLLGTPYLTMDAEWWSPLFAESFVLNGAMYVNGGDIAPGVYQSPSCMYCNLKLLADYNVEADIYQLVLDKKWTLDELAAITSDMYQDLNGDSKTDLDDFYGVATQPTSETAVSFTTGAGIRLSETDSDGNMICGAVYDPKLESVIEKVRKFCLKIPYKDINDVINLTFKHDRALFLQHKLEDAAVHLRDMESDYLILPNPLFDETQEHYISTVSGYCRAFDAIPVNTDPEFAGFITEAMAIYSHETLRPQAFEIVYKDKLARDERSAAVLDVLLDNLYVDFGVIYSFGSIGDTMSNAIFSNKEISSSLAKNEAKIQKQIDNLVANWGDQ
ncbi:MAG: hypothetical protein K6D94_02495 [Clostridiales bacterium]|nr:hypothetical protein [Clostridiales bacterium]